MKQTDRERALRRLASRYAQADGERLRAELEDLEKSGIRYPSPLLREKVQKGMSRPRVHRGWITALAACILLVLLIPALLRQPVQDHTPQGTADGGVTTDEAEADEGIQQESAVDDARDTSLTEAEGGILPLSFALPKNLSVAEADYDNGRSIYHLADSLMDDVVMTMELGSEVSFEGLLPLNINGAAAFAAAGPDYQLLTFEKENILYVLTCRYDIDTLARLGAQIL